MDVVVEKRAHRASGIAKLLGVLVVLVMAPLTATASHVVVVGDEGNAVHQRFLNGFREQMYAGDVTASVIFTSGGNAFKTRRDVADASLVITLGVVAASEVRKIDIAAPMISALVSEHDQETLATDPADRGRFASIYVEQPPIRMVGLLKAALPKADSVIIAVGESSQRSEVDMIAACDRVGIKCETVFVGTGEGVDKAMELAAQSDRVLMVLPDPQVINATTAKTLILGAYMRGISLVGYSRALVKAGALMAVHSTPEQLGRDAANMVIEALKRRPLSLPENRYPQLYSVSVNYQLARALRLDLPSELNLEQIIEEKVKP